MCEVTYCSPAPANGILQPEFQFPENSQPISAKFDAHGVTTSTGIDFNSYSRMQTTTRASAWFWRTGVPSWVMQPAKLREVITRAIEIRAGINKPTQGDYSQRLARATQRIASKRAATIATLDSLCARYVALLDGQVAETLTVKQLESEIEMLDTMLRFNENPAGFVAAVIYLSYHARMKSPEVGFELGLKPMHVRQVLSRCNKIAERIEHPVEPKPRTKSRRRVGKRNSYLSAGYIAAGLCACGAVKAQPEKKRCNACLKFTPIRRCVCGMRS